MPCKMVGHNDKFAQFNLRKMRGDGMPIFICDAPISDNCISPVLNFAKQAFTTICNDVTKYAPDWEIIISLQSGSTAVGIFGVELQIYYPFFLTEGRVRFEEAG